MEAESYPYPALTEDERKAQRERWSKMFQRGDRVRVKENGFHPGRTGTVSNFAGSVFVINFDGVQPSYPCEDPFTIEKLE